MLNGIAGHFVGAEQADRSITDHFAAFDRIERHGIGSRPIPAEFGVEGFYFRHAHRLVNWSRLSNRGIGIVTILHARMHQMDQFLEDRASCPRRRTRCVSPHVWKSYADLWQTMT